ncbi:MAG: hypothetical protein K8S87_08350 [Planctomycetes bacterium]|nr:hypothetical protein [Planctomycetota bacterium]
MRKITLIIALCLLIAGCTSTNGENGDGTESDLIIQDIDFLQNSAVIDTKIQLYITIANVGKEYAPSSKVRVYLSFNEELEKSSDVCLEVSSGTTPVYDVNYPTVSSGYFVRKNINLTIPASTRTGIYYILAEVDGENEVDEVNENNNTGSSLNLLGIISDDTDAADIKLQSFNINPATVFQGSNINVSWEVKNIGNTTASEFYVGVFVTSSANDEITINDRFIFPGRAVAGGLAPNQSANQGASYILQIPFNLPAGTYNIGIIADYMNNVPEIDELNNYPDIFNLPLQSLTIVAPTFDEYPDIEIITANIIDPVNGILEAKKGEKFTVQYQLRNSEPYACPGFSVGIYLSSDANLDFVTDRLLAMDNIYWQGLRASASPTTVNYEIEPGSLAIAGNYSIFVVCDVYNIIPETDEANNTSIALPISIVNNPNPTADDITIANLTDCTTEIGGEIDVTYDIELPASATFVDVGFFLSLDATPGADDLLLFSETVNSSNISRNVKFYVPVGFNAQVYFIFGLADFDNKIVESDETNNTSIAKLTLTTQLETPDLTVSEIIVESSNSVSNKIVNLPGDYLTVDFTVNNIGQASSSSVRVGIYLSSDSTIDFTDTLVGIIIIPTLSPNEAFNTSSLAEPLIIRFTPSNSLFTIPPQTYYIGVMADDLGQLIEIYETNNTLVSDDFIIEN